MRGQSRWFHEVYELNKTFLERKGPDSFLVGYGKFSLNEFDCGIKHFRPTPGGGSDFLFFVVNLIRDWMLSKQYKDNVGHCCVYFEVHQLDMMPDTGMCHHVL